MNIKLLILSDPDNTHTQRWISALCAKSYIEVYLIGLNKPKTDFYSGISRLHLKYWDLTSGTDTTQSGSLNKLKYLRVYSQIRKKVIEFGPDIIHAHYASSYGLLAALLNIHPFVLSVWGSDVYSFPNRSFLHKKLLQYNFAKADVLLSTSYVMAKEIHKYTNKEIKITPFGVDTNLFCKINIESDNSKFIIGTVKTLAPIYGIDTLIKAFKIVKDNNVIDVELLIIGEGPQYNELQSLVVDLNLQDNVIFLGRIPNHQLPYYYNLFDVAVSLSRSESFGVVAVEAMACECPVVVSDAEGFTEVVDNETGVIVLKDNPEEAASAIQNFIDNRTLKDLYGKRGRAKVISNYSWNANVSEMISIYKSLL